MSDAVAENSLPDKKKTVDIIFIKPEEPLPLFATVDIIDRWNRQIQKLETDIKIDHTFVTLSDIKNTFNRTADKKLIIFADYIVDDFSLEIPVEQGFTSTGENEIQFYTNGSELAPYFVAGKTILKKLANQNNPVDKFSVNDIKKFAESEPDLVVKTEELDNAFWGQVTDKKSARRVVAGFLKHQQFRPGGLVAKYLNRPVSLRMSGYLAEFKCITPNVVTIVDFFIGLAGLSLFLAGSWKLAVAGALLFQFNSIVDGIDGELARLRQHSSLFGANLDSFVDETLAALSYPAFGYYLLKTGESPLFLYIAIVTAIISYTYAMINFHTRYKNQSAIGFYYWWDLDKPIKKVRRKSNITFYIKHLFWRESIIFFLVFITYFKVLNIFLIISLVPAVVTALLLFTHIVILRKKW
jgi:phosphatidylglycerophosphate synthase